MMGPFGGPGGPPFGGGPPFSGPPPMRFGPGPAMGMGGPPPGPPGQPPYGGPPPQQGPPGGFQNFQPSVTGAPVSYAPPPPAANGVGDGRAPPMNPERAALLGLR